MNRQRNFVLITLIFPDDDVVRVVYGDGGRAFVQIRLSVKSSRRNSRTGKDDRVQIALQARIFSSSFPVCKMRPTVNPVV